MNLSDLSLELELAVCAIAAQAYAHTRYKLIVKISEDFITIEFQGYFTEQFNPKNRPDPNPNSNLYRNPRVDFSLNYFKDELILGGWWRGAILSLYYSPNQHFWLNEDGNEIASPYPDGDRFESMAAQLYPLLKQHFN